MTKALSHLGDYAKNPAFAEFEDISRSSWALYHSTASNPPVPSSLESFIPRMAYVAEATSVSLRLNASWALSHPAFSLCRDRFEQTARFSLLARSENYQGIVSYLAGYELTKHKLKEGLRNRQVEIEIELESELDGAPKELRQKYNAWSSKPLDQLVDQRDQLDGISGTKIDNEKLAGFYESIYRQGSSVSHYDLYSLRMLGLYKTDEQVILAPDPLFPIVIVLHNALFDLIQAVETTAKASNGIEDAAPWTVLLMRWHAALKKTGILE